MACGLFELHHRRACHISPRSASDTTCPTDDEVVEHAHVHQGQRVVRAGSILRQARPPDGRLGHAGRVVVRQDHRPAFSGQRARPSRGYTLVCASVPRNSSSSAISRCCCVEEQHSETLVRGGGQPKQQRKSFTAAGEPNTGARAAVGPQWRGAPVPSPPAVRRLAGPGLHALQVVGLRLRSSPPHRSRSAPDLSASASTPLPAVAGAQQQRQQLGIRSAGGPRASSFRGAQLGGRSFHGVHRGRKIRTV